MSKQNKALYWPYAITISILLIVGASVATIMVALENPVQMSDHNMQDYHDYDNNVNSFINAQIQFDRNYDIEYISESLDQKHAVVIYRVTDKEQNAVDDAKIKLIITHPGHNDLDIIIEDPKVEEGVYTFKEVEIANPGRWNLMAHVVVGENERYYNLKADTRNPNTFEY